jgi:hypothetical protein
MRTGPASAALRILLAVAAVTGGVVVSPLPEPTSVAEAAEGDIVAIVVEGTGNGHGRGMSQWGAYGYAVDHGWSSQQILDHYFGGTVASATPAGQRIKVRLTGYDGLGDVGVISPGTGVQWGNSTAPSMRAIETSAGVFDIYSTDTISCANPALVWTKIGTHVQSAGNPVRFTSANGDDPNAARDAVLGVCNSAGAVGHYRGALEVVHTTSGNRVTNDVMAEAYLRGVVPKEIAASWASAGNGAGVNAVRAQAVAARSYGLAQNRNYIYDGTSTRYATTCDTTSCQVYGGSATRPAASAASTRVEQDASDGAIRDTANGVRVWPAGHPSAGQIVSTEFSASNGPRTAGGAFPPVDDIGDDTNLNPNHKWTRIIDADAFASKHGLGTITDATMAPTQSANYQGFDGIWFDDIVVTGTAGTFRQQAWDFRNDNGYTSPGFTVRVVRERTTAKTLGLIGDSVANSIISVGEEFPRVTDGSYAAQTYDAFDSRCTTKEACAGTTGVAAAEALPADLDLAVVELGYNDDPAKFGADIDAMMTALASRGVRQVAWVNMADIRRSGANSYYGAANAALAAAAGRWPRLTVLDWNAASNTPERARWFNSDGVHLTATGRAQFALWLSQSLLELSPTHYLAPPERIELPVVGETLTAPDGSSIVVPATASGVALNVTVVRPKDAGYGTIWPCQTERPTVSSLNFASGAVIANNVIAPVSAQGTVCLYSSVGTNLVVDIAGWFPGGSAGAADPFVGLLPQRLVDTRSGVGAPTARVTPSNPLRIPITGLSAQRPDGTTVTVPADAAAVAVNVAVARATGNGFATVWPCSSPMPVASNVNFASSAVASNGVVAPIGTAGDVCIHVSVAADVIVDLAGYLGGSSTSPSAPAFTAATPTRVVDTRIGIGAASQLVQPATPLVVQVADARLTDPKNTGAQLAVPADSSAVALNLTVVRPAANGFATVWPCGTERPLASNVNFLAGQPRANSVIAPIGSDGTICIYVEHPSHVIVDIAGWFRGGSDASFVGAIPERLVDTRIGVGPIPT